MVEMRKFILVIVSKLETTMRKLYDELFTMHKEVFRVHVLQQRSKEFVQTLRNIHATITHVEEWKMQYKGAPLHLPKMMKPQIELEKAKVHMLIQNYKQLTPFISSIQASYARLLKLLDLYGCCFLCHCILPFFFLQFLIFFSLFFSQHLFLL